MCEHNIVPETKITQIGETEYMADIKLYCSKCFKPFEFLGLPVGASFERPMVSLDRTELRIPIKPII